MELSVGSQTWSIDVPAEKAVELHRAAIPSVPTRTPRELVRAALEKPFGFEPMRRALTPDDRVTVVLDSELPHVGELLSGVLEHLRTGGIPPSAVTILTAPNSPQAWIEELPDEFADVTTEIHDPSDRKKLAYLATTKGERRVYLNRTLVDADFTVLLTGRGYDPLTGYGGAEAVLFPALADDDVRKSFAGEFSKYAAEEANEVREEAFEIAALLGTPFLVQVILGGSDTVQAVVAGLLDSSAEGIRQQDARWRNTVREKPDTVVASISGDATFLDLAKAAACAARVVEKGGRIAVLSGSAPVQGEGIGIVRRYDHPKIAVRALHKKKPDDWAAAYLWCYAANKAGSLYFASGYAEDVAEELFATPIAKASELQRLIDAGERVLVIPDAHRAMVTVEPVE